MGGKNTHIKLYNYMDYGRPFNIQLLKTNEWPSSNLTNGHSEKKK